MKLFKNGGTWRGIRTAVVVVPVVALLQGSSCPTPWNTEEEEEGGISSGGPPSHNTAPFRNYEEYCVGLFNAYFCAQPCDPGEPYDARRCAEVAATGCQKFGVEFEKHRAAGLVEFDGVKGAQCVDLLKGYWGIMTRYECDRQNPQHWVHEYYAFLGAGCVNGKPETTRNMDVCSQVTVGKIPAGGSCADPLVCSGTGADCVNIPDGGCGTCVVTESTVGGPCGPQDGGWSVQCPGDSTCKQGVCVAAPGANEPCGPDTEKCSALCGYVCSARDGGTGTCVQPATDEPCSWSNNVNCPRGNTCVPVQTDGGNPWFRSGTCQPNASQGQDCSGGFNLEQYGTFEFAGAFSNGDKPMCQLDLYCVVQGDAGSGTCQPRSMVQTNAECGEWQACANLTDFCQEEDAGSFCRPRLGAGAACESDSQCQAPLFCQQMDAGSKHCRALIANGQFCAQDEECADYGTCDHGVCKQIQDVDFTLAECR